MNNIKSNFNAIFTGVVVTSSFLLLLLSTVEIGGEYFARNEETRIAFTVFFGLFLSFSYAFGSYMAASLLKGAEVFRAIVVGGLVFLANEGIKILLGIDVLDLLVLLFLAFFSSLSGGLFAKLVKSNYIFQHSIISIPFGIVIMTLAMIMAFGTVVLIFILIVKPILSNELDTSDTLPNIILGIFSIKLAGGLFWHGKRFLNATNAEKILRNDKRKLILYLRSFKDDYIGFDQGDEDEKSQSIFSPFFDASLTLEEILVKTLSKYGPVIAISTPNEFIPPPGAARKILNSDIWQAEVESLMKEARKIVILVASTKGVTWEFKKLIALNLAHKVILVFPHLNKSNTWTDFRKKVGNNETIRLPKSIKEDTILAIFSDTWECNLISGVYGYKGDDYAKQLRKLFN